MDNNVRILPPGAGRRSNRSGFIPLLIALLYGASPIDLIPDLIPLLGWSDDAIVLLMCIVAALKILKRRRSANAGSFRQAVRPAEQYQQP
ncbi:MAG: YkvA family protein [Fimbriimonadaceae bacterium]